MQPIHAAIDKPSAWVARFASLIPRGEVLDLACGHGRHSRLLASLGHTVCALDRDPVALHDAAGEGITTMQCDLESGPAEQLWPFKARRFSAVVVTNYLHRPLFPFILESLVPGGMLIYETFAAGNERFGKPSNPAFLLTPGELLAQVWKSSVEMRILAFEDGYIDNPAPAMVQRICAIRTRDVPDAGSLRLI